MRRAHVKPIWRIVYKYKKKRYESFFGAYPTGERCIGPDFRVCNTSFTIRMKFMHNVNGKFIDFMFVCKQSFASFR